MISYAARTANVFLALAMAVSLSFTSTFPGSAQENEGYITRIPSMDVDETGALNPVGLAFSAEAQSFYVIEGQKQARYFRCKLQIRAPGADHQESKCSGRCRNWRMEGGVRQAHA